MKFLRYSYKDKISYGILNEKDATLITPIEGSPFTNYKKNIKEIKIKDVKVLTPCDFSKAVCIGLNYRDHAAECNLEIPKSPVVFIKPSTSALAFGEEIIKPEMCKRIDYEAELAIVIKKKTKNIEIENIRDFILGYTCANDVTARDLQPSDGQWTLAKGFDTFCPFGPFIETEVDPNNLKIKSILDGKVMQESNTSNLIFNTDYIVSYISKIMSLNPGDIILTGTPSGISGMSDGATIEVVIENIGTLKNSVVY
ncbi:MAG: fumarylacetoacetate hydrolase family protein [Spirochaetaceae bacterium]|nr:fumarylacetoacetate hydrolase family protein [Spirochaetaceae bacterium]